MVDHITFPERAVMPDALENVAALVARYGLGASLLIVCDANTSEIAGKKLQAMLGASLHMFGKQPKPLLTHSDAVMEIAQTQHATGLIAVGSGTVNDITKYAAHRLGIPYLCVATAASMNGYSSANASLEKDGYKQSFAATAPRAVIADTHMLAKAPRRLARAGLGDTLCRSTVVADRYLSHVVWGTPFERDVFEKLRTHEAWLMQHAPLLREGAPDYMERLMQALLDAGDAMHAQHSSAVASQSEHIIAHTLDLMYGGELYDVLHGELIAVTTVTMAHLQHKMLLSQPVLRHLPREETQFHRQFGRKTGEQLYAAYNSKVIAEADIDEAQQRFATAWPDMKEQLAALVVPAGSVERAYIEAGLATKPAGIGLAEDRYNAAQSYAYLTRDRFTFLDLAAMNARRA